MFLICQVIDISPIHSQLRYRVFSAAGGHVQSIIYRLPGRRDQQPGRRGREMLAA